jgi:hypothetical protein
VTDRRIVPEPRDVRVVCVGTPASRNVGIVAASVEERPGGWRLFANVLNDAPEAARVRVRTWTGTDPDLDVPAHGAASVVVEREGPLPDDAHLEVEPGGDLRADDHVDFERRPLRVAFATGPLGYPEPHRRAVLAGLKAVMGEGLVVEVPMVDREHELPLGPSLVVGEPGAERTASPSGLETLSLRPIPPGVAGVRAPPGSVRAEWPLPGARVALDATGCDLVFAPAPGGKAPDALFETTDHGIRFLPDPLAGTPAPVDHPIWPLFLDAVVSRVHGRAAAGGWRVQGVLDPDETRLGHDVVPFDPAWLEAAPRRVARTKWRVPLLAGAAACLALLWVVPGSRRARTVP